MKHTKWIAGLLSAALLAGSAPMAFAAEAGATRGEVCEMLLSAADDYTPNLQKADLLKGYTDGQLHEEQVVTRAEALIMLNRAFGALPKPVGDNARAAYPAANFTDVPEWAKNELQNVFDAGIVAGTSASTFSPDEPVTAAQMKLFIQRAWALEGTNPNDDLYAAVNKTFLDQSTIKPGRQMSGTLFDLMDQSSADVSAMITEIANADKTYAQGTKEQKISALYHNILNWDARNETGIAPIQPYLDAIDSAQSLDDLMALQQKLSDETGTGLFLVFRLTNDFKDSTRYIMSFSGAAPSLAKQVYESGGAQKDAMLRYTKTLLQLGGLSQEDAEKDAARFWELESALSAARLDQQEYGNVDKIYNIYTMQKLREIFPNVDLDAVLKQSKLQPSNEILVMDPGMLQAYAAYLDDAHLDTLKAQARISLLAGFGNYLSRPFQDASQVYQQELLGTEGTLTDEENAAQIVQNLMPEYLGQLYIDRHFSAKAKEDVTAMVKDFISIYKERIQKLDWMSDATKEKAIRKLDTMSIKIGYPDNWDSPLDNVEIKGAADGGSYLDNIIAYSKASADALASYQNKPVDKSRWGMYAYTVNAQYSAINNDITFPAGILQAPMYDVNASREHNLGAIGYVIAHEITHAFDNNGAKFDENGNAADWWTAEDKAAFQKLCDDAVAYYDGQEAIPGVVCNGTLTLSENIADLGAAACVTEAAKKLPDADMKALYTSMARTWASTASREYRVYAAQVDVHAPEKLRGNRVVQSCDEFYTAFDITPGDGMYLAPEDRVRIW